MAADARSTPRIGAGSWWHCVVRGSGGEPNRLYAVESTAYPDRSGLELTAEHAAAMMGNHATCVVQFDDAGRILDVRVSERFAPGVPPLWFAECRESTARPPAVNLIAFTGHGQPPGTLVDQVDLSNIEVGNRDQLGAIRWYPATGEVDQIYVQPEWRRRHIAACLISAGNAISLCRGWPRFWGDGQRTQLGEQLRNARSWRKRMDELTHLAPPMTPEEGATPAEAVAPDNS